MAAAIVTTGTTLEAQAFEIIQALQAKELLIPEAERPNNAGIDPDFEALTIALNVTLPFTFATGAGGQMTINAQTYLV